MNLVLMFIACVGLGMTQATDMPSFGGCGGLLSQVTTQLSTILQGTGIPNTIPSDGSVTLQGPICNFNETVICGISCQLFGILEHVKIGNTPQVASRILTGLARVVYEGNGKKVFRVGELDSLAPIPAILGGSYNNQGTVLYRQPNADTTCMYWGFSNIQEVKQQNAANCIDYNYTLRYFGITQNCPYSNDNFVSQQERDEWGTTAEKWN